MLSIPNTGMARQVAFLRISRGVKGGLRPNRGGRCLTVSTDVSFGPSRRAKARSIGSRPTGVGIRGDTTSGRKFRRGASSSMTLLRLGRGNGIGDERCNEQSCGWNMFSG